MASAIYLGLLVIGMNTRKEDVNKKTVGFYVNLFFVFAIYDALVLLALFQM